MHTAPFAYEIWDDILRNYGRHDAGKLPTGTPILIDSFHRAERESPGNTVPETRDYAVVIVNDPASPSQRLTVRVPISTLKHLLEPTLDSLPDLSTK
jgi:hypothetical protein